MNEKKFNEVKALAQEVCQRESCRLYDIELGEGGKNRVLRMLVLGTKRGASLDQCAEISHGLGWLLDTQDLMPSGSYGLEVSSPGLERSLKARWHFEEAIEESVKFTLFQPLDTLDKTHEEAARPVKGAKHIKGIITEVLEDRILVEVDKACWEIFFDNIQKAQVIFDFKKVPQYGLKKRRKR